MEDATSERAEVRDPEARDAVMVAVSFDVKVPTLAVKVAEELAAGTLTEAGTIREKLLSESETVVPPEGAAADNVTVQVLVELGPRLVGLQFSVETSIDATRLTLALAELPLYAAVSVAL